MDVVDAVLNAYAQLEMQNAEQKDRELSERYVARFQLQRKDAS